MSTREEKIINGGGNENQKESGRRSVVDNWKDDVGKEGQRIRMNAGWDDD